MIKPNQYVRKSILISIFILSGLLTACNDEPVAEATQEVAEEEKSQDHYGPETELLDVESELTLELLGEEKKIPADMVVIEGKMKILLPSDISIQVQKASASDDVLFSYHFANSDALGENYGNFIISMKQEEHITPLDAEILLDIHHDGGDYEIDSLPQYYPSTASKYDFLTNSTDEDHHNYSFLKTIQGEYFLQNTFLAMVPNETSTKEVEALICAIAASIEYLK